MKRKDPTVIKVSIPEDLISSMIQKVVRAELNKIRRKAE
jgi:predicted DNA-binding protein (UPF0278 family)